MLKAERAEFQRTLDILRALKPVTVLPAFHGYLVDVRGRNVRLVVSDGRSEIEAAMAAEETSGDESYTVPSLHLTGLIPAMEDQVLCLSRVGGEEKGAHCELRDQRGRWKMNSLKGEMFPRIETEAPLQQITGVPVGVLREAIRRCEFAIPKNDVRYQMNTLLFDAKGDRGVSLVATNGVCLSVSQLTDGDHGCFRALLGHSDVVALGRVLQHITGKVSLGFSHRHFRMTGDGVSMIAQTVDAQYPDYEKAAAASVNVGVAPAAILNRRAFIESVERTVWVCDQAWHGVKLMIGKRFCALESHNPTTKEDASDEFPVDGVDRFPRSIIPVTIDHRWLLKALKSIDAEQVRITLPWQECHRGIALEAAEAPPCSHSCYEDAHMKRLARFPDDRLRVAGVGLAFVLALGILSFVDQRAIDKHRASHVCQETGVRPLGGLLRTWDCDDGVRYQNSA
ncbi:DNA polymerase III subunit beta [Thiolapillus sp.]|uniref:DNA polymerase III subunit beta family protein n=2 Tax=Thiolapillus sp. TaxID=2017437 RepID=UPI00263BA4D4|nr:DNA polymerase III subunit beta [Thiolapillus sp.]